MVKSLRTITIGLLAPLYFIRIGYFASIPAVLMAQFGMIVLMAEKMATKFVSVYPVARYRCRTTTDVYDSADSSVCSDEDDNRIDR